MLQVGVSESFLAQASLSKLMKEHVDIWEAPILRDEIVYAIDVLKPDTSPGLDGLTAELF